MTGTWGIVANYEGDKVLRVGARVWVMFVPGDFDGTLVRGISHGGRVIEKWVRLKRLRDFRPKFVADRAQRGAYYATKDDAWLYLRSRGLSPEAARIASLAEEKRTGEKEEKGPL